MFEQWFLRGLNGVVWYQSHHRSDLRNFIRWSFRVSGKLLPVTMQRLRFRTIGRMAARRLCLLALLITTNVLAEGQCGEKTIPVGLVLPNGRTIRNVVPEFMIGAAGKKKVRILNMDWDTGPRRIVVVLDLNKKLEAPARELESIMLRRLLQLTRPQDSLAITIANGNRELRFGFHTKELNQLLDDIDNGLKVERANSSFIDVVFEVVGWLDAPRPGDAIVVFSHEPDRGARERFKDVRQSLWSAGIRVYDISLTTIQSGTHSTMIGPGTSMMADFIPNKETLHDLSWATGGFVYVFPTDVPYRVFKIDEKATKLAEDKTNLLYSAIVEYYRTVVETDSSQAKADFWTLDLKPDVRKKFPDARIMYSRGISSCH